MSGYIYGVSPQSVWRAEEQMGIRIPPELNKLYMEVGCGKLVNNSGNKGVLYSPQEVADFRMKQGEFKRRNPEYDLWQNDRLFFYQEDDSTVYAIDLSYGLQQKIYYYETVIASSLYGFLKWIGY